METDGWFTASLSDLIDIKHGYAFEGKYFRDTPPGDILLTPGNFAVGGGFQADKLKYYDGPVSDDFVLRPGDLLVTMTDLSKNGDTLGYPAFVPATERARYLHNQRLGKVNIRPEARSLLDIKYLYYLLRSREYRSEILASATGSTVRHTSPSRIAKFRCKLPPLHEQRAIARILGTLEDKIDLNLRMNDTLEATARAIYQSWFVDFDLVHMKTDARQLAGAGGTRAEVFPDKFDITERGPVPHGWRVGVLGDVAYITMGQSPPGDTYNDVGDGLPFYQGTRDFGARFPSRRVYCTAPTRQANPGEVLLSVRAPVGRVNVATERCAIGRGLAALRSKFGFDSYLLYLLLATSTGWEKFEAEGTVFGSVSKDDVATFQIIFPTEPIMESFNRLTSPLDAQIRANYQQTATLAFTRDALLPKLLSGEIRVRGTEAVVTGAPA